MPKKGKEISPRKRATIITLLKEGYTIRGVVHTTGVAKSTIEDIKKRWQQNPDGYGSPKKRKGPLRKTSSQSDRLIVRQCLINRFSSASAIRRSIGDVVSSVSTRTIQRHLSEAGLRARGQLARLLLMPFNDVGVFCLPKNIYPKMILFGKKLCFRMKSR